MPQPNGLEYRILKYALTVAGSEGRPTSWAELRHAIADETGDFWDDELRDAFVKLHARGYITLQKWDEIKKRLRTYQESQSKYEFFMRGSFRITATAEGCVYWESLLYQGEQAYAERFPGGWAPAAGQ